MDARCPRCEGPASLDVEAARVECPRCGFAAGYDEYIEIMREAAVSMAADYIPDRPGM